MFNLFVSVIKCAVETTMLKAVTATIRGRNSEIIVLWKGERKGGRERDRGAEEISGIN